MRRISLYLIRQDSLSERPFINRKYPSWGWEVLFARIGEISVEGFDYTLEPRNEERGKGEVMDFRQKRKLRCFRQCAAAARARAGRVRGSLDK